MLPAVDLSSRLSFDVQGASALRLQASSGDPKALRAAARQFEAMFVQTMLKTMRATHFTSEDDVFGDSSSLKLYQELLDQQWAESLTKGKGLGLADMIVQRLSQDAANADAMKQADQAAPAEANQTGSAAKTPPPIPVAMPATPPSVQPAASQAESGPQPEDGTPAPESTAERKRHFIEAMLPYAQAAEKVSGVPARFALAHAALESGWGRREIVAEDGSNSHNLFGIKAGGGWDGNTASTTTTEYRQGLAMTVTERFRAYASYADAFADYGRLLKRRYQSAVAAGEDALAFAKAVAGGGYATDPGYARKLQGTIHSVHLAGL